MQLNMLGAKYYHTFLMYKVDRRIKFIITFIPKQNFILFLLEITCKTNSLGFAYINDVMNLYFIKKNNIKSVFVPLNI